MDVFRLSQKCCQHQFLHRKLTVLAEKMVVFKIIFPLAGLSWRPAAGGLRFAPPAGVVVGVVVVVAVVVLVLVLVLVVCC